MQKDVLGGLRLVRECSTSEPTLFGGKCLQEEGYRVEVFVFTGGQDDLVVGFQDFLRNALQDEADW